VLLKVEIKIGNIVILVVDDTKKPKR